jgi:hypothetical protein
MTTIKDVVNQVEMVLNDTQHPPTRTELEVLRKVLKTINAHHRFPGDMQSPHPAFGSRKSGDFSTALSNSVRLIGNHQRVSRAAVIIRS